MTKRIPLSQGKIALVDDADYQWLSQWNWTCWNRGRGTSYAMRHDYSAKPYECIYMHRLILGLEDGECADHVNRNGLDNRRCNLRKATPSQNMCNAKIQRTRRSPYKGVFQCHHKWVARIQGEYLGRFWTPEEAAYVFDQAALRQYGEFARINGITREQLAQAREKAKELESNFVSSIHLGYAKKRSGTFSRYVGVSHSKTKKLPWRAEIRIKGKHHFLGHFATEIEAAHAFNEAAVKYRGERARLNVIPEDMVVEEAAS